MQVPHQYALKQIFMKIEFENSIKRLSILCCLRDIKIAWINPCSFSLSKSNRRYSKKFTKNKYVCLNEVIWLMTMIKMLKIKNRSHTYDINRPRPRNGQKYTKCEMCLSIMMVKQHLNNIWSSIHYKVKQYWAELKKKKKKKHCL